MATLLKTPKAPATRTTTAPAPLPRQTAEDMLAKYANIYACRAKIMADAKAAAEPLTAELDALMVSLQHWSDNNPGEFDGKKMLKLEAGEFGYRAGVKKVTLPLELDLKKYLETVRKVMPTAIDEEVNSRSIIAGWEHVADLSKKLGKLGISIEQRDNFIVTPKK